MRPSVRAEKYMCVIVIRKVARRDASGCRKDVTNATITGQTDRQSATQYAAPPREGRIIKFGDSPRQICKDNRN